MIECMEKILKQKVELIGAGRTDTGGHAKKMTEHFDVETQIEDTDRFLYRMNALLPYDIAVYDIEHVKDDSHARFDAKSRTYNYYLPLDKNPLSTDSAARIAYPLYF